MKRFVLFLDLARGKSALFSVSEPVLGAMLATGTIPSLRVCLLGLLAALAGYFCVYSLNDLLDLSADREEIRVSSPDPLAWKPEVAHMDVMTLRHPVAAGALPLWAAVTWVTVMGLIGLAAAYLLRPLCAWSVRRLRRAGDPLLQPAPADLAQGHTGGDDGRGRRSGRLVRGGRGHLGSRWRSSSCSSAGRRGATSRTTWPTWSTTGSSASPRWPARTEPEVAAKVILADGVAMVVIALAQPTSWIVRGLLAAVALLTMTIPSFVLSREPRRAVGAALLQPADVLPAARRGLHIVVAIVTYFTGS